MCRVSGCKKACGRCRLRPYCSQQCAERDWQWHNVEAHCPDGVNVADFFAFSKGKHKIFIGGIEALSDTHVMSRVRAVVSCINVDDDPDERALVNHLVGPERAHMWVPVWDSADAPIERYWPAAADFIEEHAEEGVLVHCHAGKSRSVSTVIYYMLHKLRGWHDAEDALEYIKGKRCVAKPNRGFMKKLK